MTHSNLLSSLTARCMALFLFISILSGASYAQDKTSGMEDASEEMSIEELAEKKYPGLQVEGGAVFIPAEDSAELQKQYEENQENIKVTRTKLSEVGDLLREDKAFQEVLKRQNEYAASVTEANRQTNGRAGVPEDFHEKLKAFRKESSAAIKVALGEEGYQEYQAENEKLQVYYRRAMSLRSAIKQAQQSGN